ncbi:Hsp70-Hsp90 organizing protein 1 [Echinococcus granulosus]|uniref:Dyslexia susceptibility 1 candidate protein n=1 Tax=Echinococcus granulosus TaxID=6210 RepID=W6UNL6_ECHGR|nr:Dyslexia susceptibility 1 candidate protein [Echinococcus granulosus]EUB59877.1 Dyslexia susceptibility 1 candidate protein [Echinococcus granulosus]KAH9284074.1 Hsp70-Hsp90 organizing protein 1 [Echinococcus granulosus]
MFISVSDFTWFESDDEIYITVPLKGTPSKTCDLFISTRYVKIVFKPYIFECVLWGFIDVDNSKVVLENCVAAHMTLKKKTVSKWPKLEADEMKEKESLMRIRQEAIAEVQARETEREKNSREEKRLGEKTALKAMMRIEGEERNRHEETKKAATFAAMQELVEGQKKMQQQAKERDAKIAAARAFAREVYGGGNTVSPTPATLKQYIFKGCEKPQVPVRSNDKIVVSFTPRVFPTPERESMKDDEEKWLRAQAEHRRILTSKVVEDGDLSEAEKDPIWLQKKAAALFRAGDFEAAALAYTEALKRAPKLPSLHLNRSACYLQTRNFFRALEDASTALDLLKPAVPQNLNSRIKAHIRRGVAFCNLQMFKEGISEYEAAAKLNPADTTIQDDLSRLKGMMSKPIKRPINT